MNKTARNTIVYFTGTVIMGALGFLNTIILTRFLSQQVYAMYGLLNTMIIAVNMFLAFGYDSAYMRFYYNHGYSKTKFLFKCLKLPIILFVLFGVMVIEPTHAFVRYIFEDNLSMVAIFALIGYVLFSSMHRFSQLTARMEEFAGNYVISEVVAKSGFIVLLLAVYYLTKEVTFEWVVVSFMIAAAISVLINLYIFTKIKNKRNLATTEISNKDLISYGFPYMINNVVVVIVPVVEKLIIRDLTSWEILSVYTAASIFQTVVLLLTNTLTNIWNPIVFKFCDDEKTFKPILHTFGVAVTIMVTLGTAFCILLRRWLVLLLDENYYSVYIIAPAILLSSCYHIVAIIYSVGIDIKKKTGYLVVSPLIQCVISILLCYILVPSMGLVGVGIAVLISTGVSRFYRIIAGLKLYNSGVSEVKSIALCILSTIAVMLALFFTSLLADVVIFAALCILTIVIINKDIVPMVKMIFNLVKPDKRKNA